jgi:hypothetical protein
MPDQARMFFLKKRTKKLLAVADAAGSARDCAGKSFLLLFFKKEGLSCLTSPARG